MHTVVTSTGEQVPVSVWVKRLSDDKDPEVLSLIYAVNVPHCAQRRYLVVVERIARFTGWVAWDELGRIVSHDNDIMLLLGYSSAQSVILKPIGTLLDSGSFMEGRSFLNVM